MLKVLFGLDINVMFHVSFDHTLHSVINVRDSPLLVAGPVVVISRPHDDPGQAG